MGETPKWLRINPDGTKSVKEGSAEIIFDSQVFYNPIQEFNRDMSVAAIKIWSQMAFAYKYNKQSKTPKEFNIRTKLIPQGGKTEQTKKEKKHESQLKKVQELYGTMPYGTIDVYADDFNNMGFTVLEALSASGLRSIRYAKEIPKIKSITSNDLLKEAAEAIDRNAKYNNVDHIVSANQGDACQVLYQAIGSKMAYDVIDLDPYGSAAPFLDGAVQAVADGGLLCVTCTDLAVLAGGQPEACWAKYGGINIPNAPFTHELALRILLGTIQSSAARYRRSIEPMMSCSIDYYVRIFVVVRNDATVVKQASSKTSLLYYCQTCKSFETQPIGKFIRTEKGSKYGPCAVNISPDCMQCGSKYHIGGPFYSDPLHNKEFVCRMMGHVSHNHALYGTWERMVGMLVMIYEERDDPLYYVLPRMCGILHCSNPPFAKFVSGLLSTGYKVSQSHAYQQAIKTNAPPQVVWDILRQWCKLEPPSSKNISQTSPAFKILAVEPRTPVSFVLSPEAIPLSASFKLVRFQENPTANWGPQSRPGKIPKPPQIKSRTSSTTNNQTAKKRKTE